MASPPQNLEGDSESDPETISTRRIAPVAQPGEFYYDGPYLVFTEAYHLRRGWCCQSGCRHCPYGFQKPSPNKSDTQPTN